MPLSYTVGQGLKTVSVAGAASIIFEVSGEVTLPVEAAIGGLRYNKSSFTIATAKVMAKVVGTSDYNVKIISYDNTGANPITHIDDTITLSAQDAVDLIITTAAIGADRQVELKLTQQSGTPSSDITVHLE